MNSTKKTGNNVFLYRVDFPDEIPKVMQLPKTVETLLQKATDIMNLPRPAQQIFDENWNQIESIETIQPNSKLFISCTKQYNEESNKTYKSRIGKKRGLEVKLDLPIVKQPVSKPKPENAEEHIAIASSPYTVKENLRNSLLSLYSSLTPNQKAELSCSECLQALSNDTQLYFIEHTLASQFIGPSCVISNSEYGKLTTEFAMNHLKGLNINECRFAISGPQQSGKTTLLNIISSLFYQKLMLSSESYNYLFFILNWSLNQDEIHCIEKIFETVITHTFESLKYTRMNLLPIIPTLTQWFLSLITLQGFPATPPALQKLSQFPIQPLVSIAKQLHSSWNSKSKMDMFFFDLFSLPRNIALAFGLKNAVYIFDHFDLSGYEISPSGRFSQSETSVKLNEVLCSVIDSTPFFVASLNDEDFFNLFNIDSFRNLKTERVINEKRTTRITVVDPPLTIGFNDCRGAPGYCYVLSELINKIKQYNELPKKQFMKMSTVVDLCRQSLLKQELQRFLEYLCTASDDISPNVMNTISDMTYLDMKIID